MLTCLKVTFDVAAVVVVRRGTHVADFHVAGLAIF